MEIRNNADALKALLGVSSSPVASRQAAKNGEGSAVQTALTGDQASVSQVGAEVSQVAAQDGVRSEKVAAIRQAVVAGTYSVAPGAVADKVIDAMLAGGLGSVK
jgi:flagellar biosynthesis anti-sigma factor FlgM